MSSYNVEAEFCYRNMDAFGSGVYDQLSKYGINAEEYGCLTNCTPGEGVCDVKPFVQLRDTITDRETVLSADCSAKLSEKVITLLAEMQQLENKRI